MTLIAGLLLLAAWGVLTLVLPVLSALRAHRAAAQVDRLAQEVTRLRSDVEALRDAFAHHPVDASRTATTDMLAARTSAPATEAGGTPTTDMPGAATATTTARKPAVVPLETRIGARWLLYVGVATLVLGASYFVKYAFESNWITPAMRVLMAAGTGAALIEAGRRFSRRALHLYGQMLAAGGIVVLYVAAFAALVLYELIGSAVAFVAMVAITALGTLRADREKSQGLALLAVAGGFLTPFLVGGDTESPHVLFAYDAVLVVGTLWLASTHRWPTLNLLSFVATGATVAAWVQRSYTPSWWLAVELWLTLFAALFVFSWRTIPVTTPIIDQLTRAALGLTPLIYHVVSLQLLWRQTVALLVYLISATAVGVIAAGPLRRPWIRVATWLLVAAPTLGWIATRPARWDSAPFAALFAIYAMHLTAQARETAAESRRPGPGELFLLHANGLWLWTGLALLVEKVSPDWLGTMTFGVAAWHGILTALAWTRRRETALHLGALAGAFLAAGAAFELEGAAVTVAWAAEGAALLVIGLATSRQWLRVGGAVLFGAALVRLGQDLATPLPVTTQPLVNVRSLCALFVLALVGFVAVRYHRTEPGSPTLRNRAVATLVVLASLVFLFWATAEVHAAFDRAAWLGQQARGAGAVTAAHFARDVTLSMLWAGYAVALIALGIRRDYTPLRMVAIVLLGVTVAKVFLIDLDRLDRFYRILSTVGLGLLLLGGSYLYQRFTTLPRDDGEAAPSQEPSNGESRIWDRNLWSRLKTSRRRERV